ncbi:DUF4214 domain-containing protein [Zwartia sp.]|uniref:DUF4214 domain-containing protein n=1 Tax=Zwartia sp. TaxID=2978004 RepID=UPI00271CE8B4|nr:DUF4214 domain-containing protein [Zwartia sp.]MDO9023193.1 DUF4214 domain-containing protein [Zwartia sp.]
MSENQTNASVQNNLASKPANWTGVGQRDVLAASFNSIGPSDFAKLEASPVIFTYNFPGVLGTSDYPSDPLPGRPVSFNSQTWQYSLKWPWVIEQDVLPNVTGSEIGTYVTEHALKTIENKGLFNQLVPGAVDGFVSISSQYFDSSKSIKAKDVALGSDFNASPQAAIDAFNKLITNPQSRVENLPIYFNNNHQNNTFLLGPYSYTDIRLGDGNNILINSPVMFNSITSILQKPSSTSYPLKYWNEIFYPSAQGLKGTNTITVGDGNNVIYYDSSIREIKTGNGDNVFLPSFGSFNWAYNNFQKQGGVYGERVAATDNTWLTPITQETALSTGSGYTLANRYAIITNYDGSRDPNAQMVYVGSTAGAPNNPIGPNGNIDPIKAPKIGGQMIIGGKGNDVFYGIDPNFYASNPEAGTGVSGDEHRTVFRNQSGNTQNERFSYQNFETVVMAADGGSDIFYLGNPTNLEADGTLYKGSYSYHIATSHSKLASESDKKKLAFGNIDYGPDTVVVNLSANVNSYTNSSQSFDQEKGKDTSPIDLYKEGMGVGKTLAKFYKIFDGLPGAKVIPWSDIIWGAVSGVENLVKLFAPADPKPIQVDSTTLTQPLGSWKQAIAINDWNPGTAIKIAVDPTITTASDITRWNNFQLSIDTPTTSNSVFGTGISFQRGGEQSPTKLFQLEGLGRDSFGYYAYDFTKDKYELITNQHLAFFGTIAIGVDGINPLANYKAGNGFIFSSTDQNVEAMSHTGAYQFYWNDVGNSTIDLDTARTSSRDITIQFDSRSLGWYWQPELVSSLPKGLTQTTDEEFTNSITLDKDASKLWIENIEGDWDFYTFTQFDSLVEAYKSSLLSKTFYQVGNERKNLISDDQALTNALVKGLELLEPIMPDLTKLQQSSQSAVKLQNLAQITHIETALRDNLQGVHVYFKQDVGSTDVYKIFIHQDGTTPIASAPEIQSKTALIALESLANTDINLDYVVGATAGAIIFNAEANDTTEMLDSLYMSVLERLPDEEGLAYWEQMIREGFSKDDLLFSFLASEEFLSVQGSEREFVDHLYAHVLDRQADATGFEYWMNSLEDGATPADLLLNFQLSNEFVGLFGINGDLPQQPGPFGF